MNDFQMLPVEAGLFYTFIFTDDLPDGVTVTNCTFTITPSITLSNQSDNFGSDASTIKVSGAEHGVNYNLQAKATLSNGETVPKDIVLVGFNG
jgi:hypothetical protein